MLNLLTGKLRTSIAWFLFLVFYADMAVAAIISKGKLLPKVYTSFSGYNNRLIVKHGKNNTANALNTGVKYNEGIHEKSAEKPAAKTIVSKNEDVNEKETSPNIGGPGQPEMSTFKSVGADNMVNLFTGDMSYNIPLLDVDGYPVNIFYNAGPTMDQEASWVGLGWNINPGTISRNMRGLPDDFDGAVDKVTKVQSIKPDITIGVNGSKDKEVVGVPFSPSQNVGVFYNNKRGLGLEYGISGQFTVQKNIAVKSHTEKCQDTTIYPIHDFTLGAGLNVNSQSGLTQSVSFAKSLWDKDHTNSFGLSTSSDFNSRTGLLDINVSGEARHYSYSLSKPSDIDGGITHSSIRFPNYNMSFARTSFTPSIRMPITNFNATVSLKFGKEKKPVTKTYAISGYYTRSSIRNEYRTQTKAAYGYMYYERANNNRDALLDFNRLNDGTYTYKTQVISVPVYTYDVFTINGEGTGGSFRGYRGNMGYVNDSYVRTNPGKFNLGVDLGIKDKVKGGVTIGGVYSATIVGGWESENILRHAAAFKESDKLEEKGFYFKNPAEKAIIDEDYYNKMGGDKLMRPMLGVSADPSAAPPFLQPTTNLLSKFQLFNRERNTDGTITVDNNSYRKERDKRTQVITYLTALEASRVGLDKLIYSYKENIFKPGMCSKDYDYKSGIERYATDGGINDGLNDVDIKYRKRNHISEITVQEGSKRYIYGLPVYQKRQKEVTFSTEAELPDAKGLITYQPGENSVDNNKGKDGLYQSETVPAYAHSFLLTAILSPDYSDLTGDGISDDDLGTAIKFNYSRVSQKTSNPNSWTVMNWRLPFGENKANFNRGLVTSNAVTQDNKALYTYGEKELWYMHSIESKNMVATFHTSNRNDGWGVKDENGGIKTGPEAACQKKLDRIDLYSKADFIKYGDKAKPVKSVYFTYSYDLCANYDANDMVAVDEDGNNPSSTGKPNVNVKKGKLTLRSIYFTYRNNKHQKNRYRFKYAGESNTADNYNSVENDRWGNYKPHAQNPGGVTPVSNEDYPYTVQNKTTADINAANWSLNQVLLPGGAKIDVEYESDDYAYVQDRRAAQMTEILGFGSLPTSTPEKYLYTNSGYKEPWDFKPMDYRYAFFNAPVKVRTKADIKQLYLEGFKQLLLKLWVKIPKEGFEPMFVYCNIDDYDVVPGSDVQQAGLYEKFFIKVGKAARNNGSQVMETVYQFLRDQIPAKAYPGYDVSDKTGAGQVIKSLYGLVNNIRTGVLGFENNARWDGWCREIDPVRSVARLSNPFYKKIGGGHRVKSVKITDNFKRMINPTGAAEISSVYGQVYDYTTTAIINGQPQTISSGVASYEPGVGNEENPFREILQYSNANPLGPTENSNIELPVAEMFFPSPFVGYSRVTVRSIHNRATGPNIKSGVGLQETQFYTTKDFPTISEYTDFDKLSRHHFKPNPINKIFNYGAKDYMTLSQGFRIVLNDMNGKVKMQASYPENDLQNPINKTVYYYRMNKTGENKYTLDNIIPVVKGPDGAISYKQVGKDIEVMNDFREHFSFTHSAQIPLNLDFFNIGNFPVLLPTVFRAVFRNESLFRSATTLKIVNQFGILDSIENYDKGSMVGTRNLVFDAETGDVLVSRTNNEFNKPIYNFNYPAYWAYEGMGPAYKNIDAVKKGILFRNGKIEGGLTEAEVNSIFQSGDEIYVEDLASVGPKDNAGCIAGGNGNACVLLPKSNEYKIWALDITKDTRNTTKEFIFIDRYGNPYNAADANIRIVRSGRRNMADASVGSITSMSSPILYKPDNITFDKLFIDNNTNVVNTGAIEFKEKWKTQDAFYTGDEIQRVVRQAPILSANVEIQQKSSFATFLKLKKIAGSSRKYELYTNPDHFIAAQYDGGKNQPDYKHRSWLLFNFDNVTALNANSNIVNATINLPSHQPYHEVWVDGFSTGTSHNLSSSHYAPYNHPNDFFISRMQSAWPPYSQNAWQPLFDAAPPIGTSNVRFVRGTPMPGFSNQDYNEDITQVVRGMLKDKFNPGKNYATALMINLVREDIRPTTVARVCFETQNPHIYNRRIYIDLKYYNCVPENPIIYQGPAANAPTTPPPGYMYCYSDEKVTSCFSVFSRQYMNPYVQGLLGNWRSLRSFVYNGERREQDPLSATNVSKNGIIKDFETFWSFDLQNKQIVRTNPASSKWVWNAVISQYNRKGAELENYDPLGRFNAGIYGYNESLPVAVVNNSRYRLSAFDGFEDYFFKDQECNLYCQPNKRHFDTKISSTQLDETQSHTGKYSYKTAANSTSEIKIKVSAVNGNSDPDIFIQAAKTQTNAPWVVPKGIGLLGTYMNKTLVVGQRIDEQVNLFYGYSFDLDPPFGLSRRGPVTVIWTGKIQVAETGVYNFRSRDPNDFAKIRIARPGSFNTIVYEGCNSHIPCNSTFNSVNLTAGVLYDVEINFDDENSGRKNDGWVDFEWYNTCKSKWELVPKVNMYPTEADAAGSVLATNMVCTKINQIKAQADFLIDEFNLIPDEKMVASVWVKKGTSDCHCPSYDGFTMKLKNTSIPNIVTFTPKGSIIEGWQQFEAVFTVPSGEQELSFNIDNANNNQPLFIDDLRFHPFNANMKSFVYNPYNLKPAAELDENNYATFYEYDDDGTLIRVKKETRLGIKTIQETRSALQKTITDF